MSQQREFTGVFIPAHIWEHPELTSSEKMMLGEIDALSKSKGWCFASRKHFAGWLRCTESNISHYLTKLQQLGFIELVRVPGSSTRMRIVSGRFYGDEVVSPTHRGGESHSQGGLAPLTGGVSGVHYKYKLNTSLNSTLKKGKNEVEEVKEDLTNNFFLKDFFPEDKNHELPAAASAAFNQADEIDAMETNYLIMEAFTMAAKVPKECFVRYLIAFKAIVNATERKHNNRSELRNHFLNYSRKRYASEVSQGSSRPESGLPKNLRRF
jgi:hypothetical protein